MTDYSEQNTLHSMHYSHESMDSIQPMQVTASPNTHAGLHQPAIVPVESVVTQHHSNNLPPAPGTDRCKFCGQELLMDATMVVAHFNSHWRQSNIEALNPGLYEHPHLVGRLSNTSQFIRNHDNTSNVPLQTSNQLINPHGLLPNHCTQNQSNSFSYSPQTEPSNLSLPENHLKCPDNEPSNLCINNTSSCMENEPSNSSVHNVSNASNQEVPSNLSISDEQQNHLVCSNVMGMASPHHSMDSPGMTIAGNRSSPLNLTGRPKIVSSPILSSVNIDGNNQMASMEHPCGIHSRTDMTNMQSAQPINFSSPMSNDNHVSQAQSFANNYAFSNNYYGSSYHYNNHTQLESEPPSCRLQNTFPHYLENIGLSIPILTPNAGHVQRQDISHCTNTDKPIVTGISVSNNGSINESLPLAGHCPTVLTSCNHSSNAHLSHCISPQNTMPDHRLGEENKVENHIIGLCHCNVCRHSFPDKQSHQSHAVHFFNGHKKSYFKDNNIVDNESLQQIATSSSETGIQNNSSIVHTKIGINLQPEDPVKPYKCYICNHEFILKEELREHFTSHEAAKPFHCDTCGLGVSNHRALKRHKLTHTGFKPNKCETCGKSFLQKHDLNRHMNVHNRPKYLTCEQCKRIFTAISSYKSHKCKGAKEIRPFLCHICGDGCSNKLAWSYHMWKHTKNPMFVPFQDTLSADENI